MEFQAWPKISRFFDSKIIISEKIDGTNACVIIGEDGSIAAQSRAKIITPNDDNYGFAGWVERNADELKTLLGPGYHFGEWWGNGIQRKYGMDKKVFSLFNVHRWGELINHDPGESICDVVPFKIFELEGDATLDEIIKEGAAYFMRISRAAEKYGKEFTNPEGYCIFHERSQQIFKVPVNK